MKLIDSSLLSNTISLPFKEGTLKFLQDSHKETVDSIMCHIKGVSSGSYIVWGCSKSSSAGLTTIEEGAVYLNGEIYLSPLQSFADPSGGNVVIGDLSITQFTINADPVQLAGTGAPSPVNIHNIRRISWKTGAAGTGTLGNYSDFYPYFVRRNWTSFYTTLNTSGTNWINNGLVTPFRGLEIMTSNGFLSFSGSVKNTGAASTTIFTLNSLVRPTKDSVTWCLANVGGASMQMIPLFIASITGIVSTTVSLTTNTIVYFDGVSVRLD